MAVGLVTALAGCSSQASQVSARPKHIPSAFLQPSKPVPTLESAKELSVARVEALQSAIRDCSVIFSYRYEHLEADLTDAQDASTGDLKNELQREYTPALRKKILQSHADLYALLQNAKVIGSPSVDNVQVAGTIVQAYRSDLSAGPRESFHKARLTMTRVGNDWKASETVVTASAPPSTSPTA
jgi:hypothetical protein